MSSKQFKACISKLRARDPNLSFALNPEQSAIYVLDGNLSDPADTSELEKSPFVHARRFIADNKALFGNLDEETGLSDEMAVTDETGQTHLVLYQKYGDARVFGGQISIHYGKDRTINLVKSDLVHAIKLPLKPEIGRDQAIEIAIKDAGPGAEIIKEVTPELIVINAVTASIERKKPKNYLCWKIEIVYPTGPTSPDWIYYVDALTGGVLFRTSSIKTGSGAGFYSHGGPLSSDISGSTHILRDSQTTSSWPIGGEATRPVIHTYDDAGSSNQDLANYSEDVNDVWDNNGAVETDNHAEDQRQEVDIHLFLSLVMIYFKNVHARHGLDGCHEDTFAHAHNERMPNNAFWCCSRRHLYFSSGDWETRRFVSTLDIVGHEYTHGLNYFMRIVQNYMGETGAVDEAICDLFGYFIARHYDSRNIQHVPQPLQHGQQSYLMGRARNIADPDGDHYHFSTDDVGRFSNFLVGYYPDHYSIRYTGPNDQEHDWGGVHINSTIISHAVYLMMYGGTHRHSGITVIGIGEEPVKRMLYAVMVHRMINETSNFADFRTAFRLAWRYLFYGNLDYLATINSAFCAVGIGPDLYIRGTRDDRGEEPRILSLRSPDIIVRHERADAATLAAMRDIDNESLCQTISRSSSGSRDHYIYFRVFNRGSVPVSGTIGLAVSYSPAPPWEFLGEYEFTDVPAATGRTPGVWVPTNADQCIVLRGAVIDRLYVSNCCLFGQINSDADPRPVGASSSEELVRKNNNSAFRECAIE